MVWIVGIGGALGAAARFLLGNLISDKAGKSSPFPAHTWIINVSGSFLLGLSTQLHFSNHINEWLWLFAGTGF